MTRSPPSTTAWPIVARRSERTDSARHSSCVAGARSNGGSPCTIAWTADDKSANAAAPTSGAAAADASRAAANRPRNSAIPS